MRMLKGSFLLAISAFVLGGCVSPEEQRLEARRQASLTPFQKCIEAAERSSNWCGLGCSGLLLSRYTYEQEQGRVCMSRCENTKAVAFNSCNAYR